MCALGNLEVKRSHAVIHVTVAVFQGERRESFMMKNVFAASAALAGILSLTPGVWAKPSDLPVDNQMQWLLGQESTVPVQCADTTETTIDTVVPAVTAAYLETWWQWVTEDYGGQVTAILSKTPYVRWLYLDPAVVQEVQGNLLFQLAEGCRLKGDYARARTFYQQVHMLTPTSRQGQLAIDRLVEIEERMRESEESTVPMRSHSSEQSFRDIRHRTIPLGMVEVTY
jgi:hypothetical protein